MSDCCKIIRLLKEVKRKADSSFAEINHKISRLESRYNILLKQNDTLKSQLEESRIKLQELDKPRPMEEQSQKKRRLRSPSRKRSMSQKRRRLSLQKTARILPRLMSSRRMVRKSRRRTVKKN
ncbi:hypothetical protein GWI33_016782 [Rhynchophorus ferrugineus]|uniref:Uncharacterized protein n=1 Tax=Rhynchophorus ferrugineus TaxID=354439 RepID=A0A834I0H3_RHYFE|nr:hypothetical protein GWI33_016782 [Rhynchophorus ferrugineus]